MQDWLPGQDVGLLLLLTGGTPVLALAYDEIVAQQADGSVYFFNVDTGASSWDRPGAGVDVKADLGMAE